MAVDDDEEEVEEVDGETVKTVTAGVDIVAPGYDVCNAVVS